LASWQQQKIFGLTSITFFISDDSINSKLPYNDLHLSALISLPLSLYSMYYFHLLIYLINLISDHSLHSFPGLINSKLPNDLHLSALISFS